MIFFTKPQILGLIYRRFRPNCISLHISAYVPKIIRQDSRKIKITENSASESKSMRPRACESVWEMYTYINKDVHHNPSMLSTLSICIEGSGLAIFKLI
jgi:hypothetical protein